MAQKRKSILHKRGRLCVRRHINQAEDKKGDDMDLVTRVEEYSEPPPSLLMNQDGLAPSLDWRGMSPTDHFVQFYESDVALVDAVSGYIGAGLETGEGCVVIATQ